MGLHVCNEVFKTLPSFAGAIEKLRFQIAFVTRAVWPGDELVDEHTHAALLAKLECREWYFRHDHAPLTPPTGVIPLSQLQLVEKRKRVGDAASSSGRSSSAWSGWSGGSIASVGSAGSADGPFSQFGQLTIDRR